MKLKYMNLVAGAAGTGGNGNGPKPAPGAGDQGANDALINEANKGVGPGAGDQGKQPGEDIKEKTPQEKFDEMLNSEEGKLIMEHVANRAAEILKESGFVVKVEGNAPGPVAGLVKAEAPALSDHEAKIKKFGKDYVDAKKGELTKTFSKIAWSNMQVDKTGNTRSGWARVVQTPPELQK